LARISGGIPRSIAGRIGGRVYRLTEALGARGRTSSRQRSESATARVSTAGKAVDPTPRLSSQRWSAAEWCAADWMAAGRAGAGSSSARAGTAELAGAAEMTDRPAAPTVSSAPIAVTTNRRRSLGRRLAQTGGMGSGRAFNGDQAPSASPTRECFGSASRRGATPRRDEASLNYRRRRDEQPTENRGSDKNCELINAAERNGPPWRS
jgi:hypothetical protein